ncbi:MAG: Gfo/Idh/MocA family protein, partial [Hyphomicrobiaceae bacterium]
MTSDPIRLGVVGLGRAFVLMQATFRSDKRVQLVAAADPRPDARDRFEAEYGATSYTTAEDLFAQSDIQAVYIASPHQYHADQAIAAAQNGKHALVEKPMAVTIDDGLRMIAAFEEAGRHLLIGPSHSFDAPVRQARTLIDSGELGRVRMLHALNCTDFLYRPRRAEELRTEDGGGVIFSQGVHQVDVVRLLCSQHATQITAATGAWDPERPTEGAYSALITFDNGAFASLAYSGYGRFDSDIWQDGISELGRVKNPNDYGRARAALAHATSPQQEADLKTTRAYGAVNTALGAPQAPQHHEHFGPLLVFCDHGDLRVTPDGVHLYRDATQEFLPCPFRHPR